MPNGSTKVIKRRIKSVTSTKKITKAMELVAASKMRKAVEAAQGTRKYAILSWNLLVNLSKKEKEGHQFFADREVKKALFVIVTSNRGLCGGLNANIQRFLNNLVDNEYSGVKIDVLAVGKKGFGFAKKKKLDVIGVYDSLPDTLGITDIFPITKVVIEKYLNEVYDKVAIVYTDFISPLVQKPKIRQILPVSERDLEKTIAESGHTKKDDRNLIVQEMDNYEYIFEPNKVELLSTIVPRLVETQVYQSVLESLASEHSARMLAMRSASDAAEDMIADLTFTFNQARQAGITQELTEIAAGAAALS